MRSLNDTTNDSPVEAEPDDQLELDPIFVSSRREAGWILLMWVACFIWTLTACGLSGYPTNVDPETFPTLFGIPRWVAIGIALPWMVSNVVTIWFCLRVMKDGDLDDGAFSDGVGLDDDKELV